MGSKTADRPMEFTNPKIHIGWQGSCPIFVVFSMEMARVLFEEFERGVIAICVAVPKSARAENLEQAVAFFSDDNVALAVGSTIFGFGVDR